jgi:hypothetical protein
MLRLSTEPGGAIFLPLASAVDSLRLYLTAMGQEADAGGLAWRINQREAGMTLEQQTTAFLHSDDFAARSMRVSDAAFVTSPYEDALGRATDQAGFAY